ncbi:DUF2939 domain-containing protein [Undibacterium sp. TJN19]|uniref:DUF2939 domain-containing protein n=1 Tax=Undibacterium sp. TJN19 TaxID=3413055 RepID=UPI003BF2E539
MKTSIKILAIALPVGLAAAFYGLPYLTIHNLRAAAERNDVEDVAQYIDKTELKKNLELSLTPSLNTVESTFNLADSLLDKEIKKSKDQAVDFASAQMKAVYQTLISAMADVITSPKGMDVILKGGKVKTDNGVVQHIPSTSGVNTDISYVGFNKFTVKISDKNSTEEPGVLTFKRYGLWDWKLVNVN